jgi:hypothetical protein
LEAAAPATVGFLGKGAAPPRLPQLPMMRSQHSQLAALCFVECNQAKPNFRLEF